MICPNNFFTKNGHCVQCPLSSVYDVLSGKCECLEGFFVSS